MALHFSGNQYEQAYKPVVLRNWEVPKIYNDKPKKRTGRTQIISNDRGHLLPGVPKSTKSPWGHFKGTWHLPKKIDRRTADELNGLPKKITCEEKRQKEKQRLEEIKEETEQPKEVSEPQETSSPPQEPVEKASVKEEDRNKENTCPYVPGDLTDEHHRLPSHDELAKNRYNQDRSKPNGYPRYREDFSKPLPQIEKPLTKDEVEEECQNHKAMAEATYSNGVKKCSRKKTPSPIIDAIRNFQLAKRLHRENLEHDPLPDTITHSKYRKLQMQRSEHDPGLALENENYASGVGWKGYPGYGPNRCTKLKVYRPKTCGHGNKHEIKNDGRPSSVTSFDRKWRFIRQRKVSPIELAICWDLTPENPNDEPKRTPHIDGSNGSLAPAVFSLVHTPKDEDSRKSSLATVESGPIFDKAPVKQPHEKDFVLDRPKTSYQEVKRRTSRDSSQSGDSHSKKRAKSAYNLNNNHDEGKSCSHCVHEEKNEVHQSTPNLSDYGDKRIKNSRMCMACEMKNVSLKDRRTKKDEYKMAFKAGVPQKIVSSYRNARYDFQVPKQKDPYSTKNYVIHSLAPPFSLQKDKRQDYPEHWRLATVYQHSYKPIHTRKRPLLATVFK